MIRPKLVAAFAAAALIFCSFPVPAVAQTAPSGRSIVYPLENQPSVDTVLQPARFARLAMGSWMLHALQLSSNGAGVVSNCTTAPGTGLFVTVAPALSGSLCGLYQVTNDDANPLPIGYTPQLAADSTLIVVQALQSTISSNLGPLTAPGTGGQSIYYLVEAQITTSDVAAGSRAFINASTGVVSHPTVPTQRQDSIAYQLKAGTASSSPAKPAVDSGWVPVAFVLVPNGKTQILTGDISDGGATFHGFVPSGSAVTLNATPAPAQTGNASITGTMAVGGLNDSALAASSSVCTDGSSNLQTSGCPSGTVTSVTASGPCLVSSGGATPNLSIPTPLPTGCGGTGQTGSILTLNPAPSATPTLPPSGGQFYTDSGGALHFQSQWYDAPMPGGKFIGDANHSWFVGHTAFGFTASGTNGNVPVVFIKKTSTSTVPGIAFNLQDTLSPNISATETSVVFQTICPLNTGFNGQLCVGLQVEADKTTTGEGGIPFAGNFVSKDTTGTANQSQVAIENDINTSEPASSTANRVINDNFCKEVVAQVTGETSCSVGVRSHVGDYRPPQQTGPAKLLAAFQATNTNTFPGSAIGDAFQADGGDDNGLNLFSGTVVVPTLAAGTIGTNTLTFTAALNSGITSSSPGAWISDGGEGFIPAGTTITGVSTNTSTNVTTITMSHNQTGNVASGQNITITQAYGVGINLNGTFNIAARSTTTQYGLEETQQNGLVEGSATGGAKGVGTINAQKIYVNGAASPSTLYRWGVPVVLPSSGTFTTTPSAASGLTLDTAITSLATICSASVGCYMYFPANAICTATNCGGGSSQAAGLYYAQCADTTHCQVFNNVLSSGVPTIVSSPTSFGTIVTTGHYTQTFNTDLTMLTLTIPANSMGANGSFDIDTRAQRIANANTVTEKATFGGTNFTTYSSASKQWYGFHRTIMNVGATNAQTAASGGLDVPTDQAGINALATLLAKDTTTNQSLTLTLNLVSAATDWIVIFGGSVTMSYAP